MQVCLNALCIAVFLTVSSGFFLYWVTLFLKGDVGTTARRDKGVILVCTRALWVTARKIKISSWVPELFLVFVGHNPCMCLVIFHVLKTNQHFLVLNCFFISHCLLNIWERHCWFWTSSIMCWMLSSASKLLDIVFSLYFVELRWQHKETAKHNPSKCNPSERKHK